MSTVQLVVDGVFIDLYEQDPIKLTYSIEDITNTETKSVFSRQFRVPATTHNFEFFSTAFEINGLDFDVTQKYEGIILDNGSEIIRGQFRMTKIFRSEKTGKIDYECLFLGETRSFGSVLGDKMIAALDFTEYSHTLAMAQVINSWQAYPEGALTDGLFDGDILYPLVDFGNVYNETTGAPTATDISGKPATGTTGDHFTENNQGLPANRFKPMIRARVIWDKIFETAGYTYTSNFIDSELFTKLYISCWGNEPSRVVQTDAIGTWRARRNASTFAPGIIVYQQIEAGAGLGYDNTTGIYTVPTSVNGIPVTPSSVFNFGYSIEGGFGPDQFEAQDAQITGRVVHNSGGVITYYDSETATSGAGGGSSQYYFGASGINITVSPGDQVYVEIVEDSPLGQFSATTGYFRCNSAVDGVQIVNQIKNDYKQIDFIKDIITKFRLVMSPNKLDRNNFIIEPWKDYIASGDYFDWTKKVDLNKDFVIEPLFFTQTEEIDFMDREDKDYLNDLNLNEFGEVFGMLKVDSQNELLKGKRNVTTKIPPTPITQINPGGYSGGESFIIPQIYAVEPGSNPNYILQKIPMSPHTRLLFYNGLQDTNLSSVWYDELNNTYTDYPMVSFYENFPNTIADLNLNWQIETGYAYEYTGFNPLLGQSAYQEYWSQYIESLYSKWGRRVTVYVEISSEDLREFSFDDLIFIKDTYYYVEKIYDAPIGQDTLVKVDLIKIERAVNLDIVIPPDDPSQDTPWNTAPENYNDEDDVWQVR
jgi:hypothetical protein